MTGHKNCHIQVQIPVKSFANDHNVSGSLDLKQSSFYKFQLLKLLICN